MSFQIGTAVFNANNTVGAGGGDLQPLITQWQPQTCGGVNVGAPVQALQVVAINKQQMAICNPEAIIGTYNTATRTVLTDGQSLNIPAGTVHSISVKQVTGNGTIDLDEAGPEAIDAGEFDSFTASTLLATEFDFDCITGKMVINTIGPAGV